MTDGYRDEILLAEWANEFSLRFPGPHILPIVSQHVDEKRRAELTRSELPLKRREFASVLSRSLDDSNRAFIHIVKTLDERSRGAYTTGTAADFTTDGNRGKAAFKFDGSTAYPVYFVKDERGWHYAGLRPPPDAHPKQQVTQIPPAKPWTNGPAAKYASPQEAFAAFVKALRENDPETAWNCVTDDGRRGMLQFFLSSPPEMEFGWYVDMGKYYALLFREGRDRDVSGAELFERTCQAMADAIREPKVLCSALVKEFALVNAATPERDRIIITLRDVAEDKEVAHGLVQCSTGQLAYQLRFKKVNGGWRLEPPRPREIYEMVKALAETR